MSRAEDIFQKLIYFGEEAIDDYIVNSQTEELFLDFKRADSTGIRTTAATWPRPSPGSATPKAGC